MMLTVADMGKYLSLGSKSHVCPVPSVFKATLFHGAKEGACWECGCGQKWILCRDEEGKYWTQTS